MQIIVYNICVMANTEANNIPFDNTKITFDCSPNNIAISDELLTGEVYNYEKETQYAKAKRISKGTKIAVIGVSVTAAAGGIFGAIAPDFMKNQTPICANPVCSYSDHTLFYSFDAQKIGSLIIKIRIVNTPTKVQFYTETINEDGHVEGTLDCQDYPGENVFYVNYTNNADLEANLYTYKFIS